MKTEQLGIYFNTGNHEMYVLAEFMHPVFEGQMRYNLIQCTGENIGSVVYSWDVEWDDIQEEIDEEMGMFAKSTEETMYHLLSLEYGQEVKL